MSATAMFSSRCFTDDVPGISSTLGATDSVHASAICAGVRPSFFASAWTAGWPSTGLSALNAEPSGKNGTNAMPCSVHASSTGCDVRSTRLYAFCTQTISVRSNAIARCSSRMLLSPMPPISPSSRAWIIVVS